jgi:hypothetical protein
MRTAAMSARGVDELCELEWSAAFAAPDRCILRNLL